MAALIDISNIKRDFQLGTETIHVLKGIPSEINKTFYNENRNEKSNIYNNYYSPVYDLLHRYS